MGRNYSVPKSQPGGSTVVKPRTLSKEPTLCIGWGYDLTCLLCICWPRPDIWFMWAKFGVDRPARADKYWQRMIVVFFALPFALSVLAICCCGVLVYFHIRPMWCWQLSKLFAFTLPYEIFDRGECCSTYGTRAFQVPSERANRHIIRIVTGCYITLMGVQLDASTVLTLCNQFQLSVISASKCQK